MRYFSMFSGIGGFELGIEKSREHLSEQRTGRPDFRRVGNGPEPGACKEGWDGCDADCVGFSEIDKYTIQTYTKHFPAHKNYGDAKHIDWKEVQDFDLLVGGFPCQSFSIAGKRGGFADTRGTLFFEIARCIKDKRPPLCLLENVKGLLSHDEGRTFSTILSTLSELGYDCEWQVLNSKHFGVPQNRERVFIIGHLREKGFRQIFPIGEIRPGNQAQYGERERVCDDTQAMCLKARDYKGGGKLDTK